MFIKSSVCFISAFANEMSAISKVLSSSISGYFDSAKIFRAKLTAPIKKFSLISVL